MNWESIISGGSCPPETLSVLSACSLAVDAFAVSVGVGTVGVGTQERTRPPQDAPRLAPTYPQGTGSPTGTAPRPLRSRVSWPSGRGRALAAAWRLALACGLFQFFMPLLGCFLIVSGGGCPPDTPSGERSMRWFSALDHWLAFGLLALVGGNMVRGYFAKEEAEVSGAVDRLGLLLSVALATSIDALVVGAGFALAGLPVMELAVIAGVVTAAACAAGVYFGRCVGAHFGKKMELLGGALLILIGLEILVSHLIDHGGLNF